MIYLFEKSSYALIFMKLKLNIYLPLWTVLIVLFLSAAAANAQSLSISGSVKDIQGQAIVGASVLIEGSTKGVVADLDGNYSIQAQKGQKLVCNCIGYVSRTITITNAGTIDFVLEEDAQLLDATVVVGYGTLKKSQLVGSVESVSGEVLENRTNANITRSLQGEVPGLNIVMEDGKPSHSGKVYIRGGATSYISRGESGGSKSSYSIGQGGSALVLIDGVEGEMSSVNPDDVESVSVLKDASSAAIYGARAAYGVILITTKDAKKEKVSVNYNGSVAINSRTVHWEDNVISDGLTFIETMYDHWLGHDATPTSAGTNPTKFNSLVVPSNYLELYRDYLENGGDEVQVINGKYTYFGSGYNYLKMYYKRSNITHSHNISVSGSSKKVSYNVSGRYYGQDGIYKIGDERFDNYNLRAKIKIQAKEWLGFDANFALNKIYYKQPIFSKKESSGVGSQLWQIAMGAFPMIPPYNPDGSYTYATAIGGYAAFAEGNSAQIDDKLTVTTSLGVTLEPIKDVLKIRGEFSYKPIRRQIDRYVAPFQYSTAPGSMVDYVSQTDSYKHYYNDGVDYISANAILTYTPSLGPNHNLNLVAGWNLENYDYHRKHILRQGMLYSSKPNFELMDGTEITLEDNNSSYGLVGFFVRANYTLLNRYIFEFSGRADGSSKFPKNQQWGFFPSGSFGWRISEEPWMKDAKKVVSNLKLRINAGSLGNGAISPYQYLTIMGISKTAMVFDGALENKVSDPSVIPDNLTWETVTTYDVGLDMDLFNNRLSFSGDYYIRNTDNLYVTGPEIPAIFGDKTPKGHCGALQTRGWELTLAWKDQVRAGSSDFMYNIKASLWDSRTWVTKYYNQSGGIFNYYEGKELGEIWGFRTDGYFLSNQEASDYNSRIPNKFHNYVPTSGPYAGDLKFLDSNKDHVISQGSWTLDDHGDLERIGNEMPRYQFGLNMDFRWNGIGLSMFWQGVGKRDWYPSQGSDFFWGGYARAYCAYVLKDQAGNNHVQLDKSTENWTVANADAKPYWTRRTYGVANSATGALTFPNDYFLQNAAYIRLKNLTIDYSFPQKWLEKIKIEKLRIYFSAENLFTWSPMMKHTSMFDPEVISNGDSDFHSGTSTSMGDGYSYPLLKSYTFGLNITF